MKNKIPVFTPGDIAVINAAIANIDSKWEKTTEDDSQIPDYLRRYKRKQGVGFKWSTEAKQAHYRIGNKRDIISKRIKCAGLIAWRDCQKINNSNIMTPWGYVIFWVRFNSVSENAGLSFR